MKRQVRLQNAPAWVIGTISGIVFAIVFTGLQAPTGTVPIGIVALVGAVFEALFFGSVMGLFFARARRKSGDGTTTGDVRRAMKTGTIPAETETAQWSQPLTWLQKQAQLALWLNPVVFGLFAALGVYVALGGRPWIWVCVPLFVAMGVYSSLASARDLRRIRILRADLGYSNPGGASDD